MKTDIEIARETKLQKITAIAEKLNLDIDEDIELYGNYKCKILPSVWDKIKDKPNGKLILTTAINPTPAGEGKTTLSIGLAQAMARINKNVILALREPSLGPCMGVKGGATGGGYSQVAPMEDINLHFTGDIHAITSAHNLIASLLDNHIYHGNKLNVDTASIKWKRAVDLNDRNLRNIIIGIGDKSGNLRADGFMITVASEIMALLCLSKDMKDLKENLAKIVLAFDKDKKPITVADIDAVGAVAVLLKDALKPNLVQTLEGVPALIHGGPFANIAHGCNSIIATKTALKLADYVITEAGFGADLGAEKFFDIKCRKADIKPDAVVLVATCRSLKYNGGVDIKEANQENMEALAIGIKNLERHIENIKKYNLPLVVALNKFDFDTEKEIEFIKNRCSELGVEFAVSEVWGKGGAGGIELAEKVAKIVDAGAKGFKFLYDLDLPLQDKITKIATEIYGAKEVVFGGNTKKELKKFTDMGYGNLPVCIAKTQYSFSANPKLLAAPKDFLFDINEVRLSAGAGFVVCLAGDIMTMPGLPKTPAANSIDIEDNGHIVGLF